MVFEKCQTTPLAAQILIARAKNLENISNDEILALDSLVKRELITTSEVDAVRISYIISLATQRKDPNFLKALSLVYSKSHSKFLKDITYALHLGYDIRSLIQTSPREVLASFFTKEEITNLSFTENGSQLLELFFEYNILPNFSQGRELAEGALTILNPRTIVIDKNLVSSVMKLEKNLSMILDITNMLKILKSTMPHLCISWPVKRTASQI